jgi:hypothetical protein
LVICRLWLLSRGWIESSLWLWRSTIATPLGWGIVPWSWTISWCWTL